MQYIVIMKKIFPSLYIIFSIIGLSFLSGCFSKSFFKHKMKKQKIVQNYVFENAVIAHRGTTYWAPEETEVAYRWARNIGADYLEVDIQRTSDGVLIALHDDDFRRTSDIMEVYNKGEDFHYLAAKYTYIQLMNLDAGSWFNKDNKQRARNNFGKYAEVLRVNTKAYTFNSVYDKIEYTNDAGNTVPDIYIGGKQYISTLEDVLMIAKGWIIARDKYGNRLYKTSVKNNTTEYSFFYVKDPKDNNNRPGVYIEVKEPKYYNNIEKHLYDELTVKGWNILKNKENISTNFFIDGNVNTGNTNGKIVLQTFSPESLSSIDEYFKGEVPVTFLLWLGDGIMDKDNIETYNTNLEYALKYNTHFIGPSIGGGLFNYYDLLTKSHHRLISKKGFMVHGYSFDTKEQHQKYFSSKPKQRTNAVFTNRSDISINYFIDEGVYDFKRDKVDAKDVLNELGY